MLIECRVPSYGAQHYWGRRRGEHLQIFPPRNQYATNTQPIPHGTRRHWVYIVQHLHKFLGSALATRLQSLYFQFISIVTELSKKLGVRSSWPSDGYIWGSVLNYTSNIQLEMITQQPDLSPFYHIHIQHHNASDSWEANNDAGSTMNQYPTKMQKPRAASSPSQITPIYPRSSTVFPRVLIKSSHRSATDSCQCASRWRYSFECS